MATHSETPAERRDTHRSRLLIGAGASLVAGLGLIPSAVGLSETATQLLVACGIGIVLASIVTVLARLPAIAWATVVLAMLALTVLMLEYESTVSILASIVLAIVAGVGGLTAAVMRAENVR